MKLRFAIFMLALVAVRTPAAAQWQTTNHSVPIGKGLGVTGFDAAAPGAAGQPLLSNGPGVDPSFQFPPSGNERCQSWWFGDVATATDAVQQAAIQAAINACSYVVLRPYATYNTTSTLHADGFWVWIENNKSNFTLDGNFSTARRVNNSVSGAPSNFDQQVLMVGLIGAHISNVTVKNITLDGNNINQPTSIGISDETNGLVNTFVDNLTVENVTVHNQPSNGLSWSTGITAHIDNITVYQNGKDGFYEAGGSGLTLTNWTASENNYNFGCIICPLGTPPGYGVAITGTNTVVSNGYSYGNATGLSISNLGVVVPQENAISNVVIDSSTHDGLAIQISNTSTPLPAYTAISNLAITSAGGNGVLVVNSTDLNFSNLYVSNAGASSFVVSNGQKITASGMTLDTSANDGLVINGVSQMAFQGRISNMPTSAVAFGGSLGTASNTNIALDLVFSGNAANVSGAPSFSTNTTGRFAWPTAPAIASGFCTSPSIVANNGALAFTISVGTSCSTGAGILVMPTAPGGWACKFNDITNNSTNDVEQTGSGVNTITLQNYVRTTGVAGNFANSHVVNAICNPY